MTWHRGPMVAFDTETTGPDPETARIVTATVAQINNGDVQVTSYLVNPGIDIPAEATAIHGITNEQARADGIDPINAARLIHAHLLDAWDASTPVVAYNASYDLTVLDRELRRHTAHGLQVTGPVVDPYVIDKQLDRYRRGKRTLTATCEHYRVRLDGAHDATADALAAARLAWRLAETYPQQLADLAALNGLQAQWRREWAAEFEQYLARQGKPEHVDGAWPLRELQCAAEAIA